MEAQSNVCEECGAPGVACHGTCCQGEGVYCRHHGARHRAQCVLDALDMCSGYFGDYYGATVDVLDLVTLLTEGQGSDKYKELMESVRQRLAWAQGAENAVPSRWRGV